MITFRQKDFSKKIIESAKYVVDHPTLPFVALGSTMSTANYITNKRRHKEDSKYQKEQLNAMNNLTKTLNNATNSMNSVNESLKNNVEKTHKKDSKGFQFFRKGLFN